MSAEILAVKYNENNVPYIGIGEHEIRLESEPPSEAVMEKARKELREVPEIVEPAIAELRELLKGKQRTKVTNICENKRPLQDLKFLEITSFKCN